MRVRRRERWIGRFWNTGKTGTKENGKEIEQY